MTGLIVLSPRTDLSSSELRLLGHAIVAWNHHQVGAGFACIYEPLGVADLFKGELPQPLAIRAAQHREFYKAFVTRDAKTQAPPLAFRAIEQAKGYLGDMASSREIFLSVSGGDRTSVIAELRRLIPPGLVADIIINGRSWDEPT